MFNPGFGCFKTMFVLFVVEKKNKLKTKKGKKNAATYMTEYKKSDARQLHFK